MGPGVYKTQSINTKNKSPYPTGTIWLRKACLFFDIECKSCEEGWSTGKLVVIQPQPLQFRQLAQFSRNGTWGIQNPVKTYKKQVTLSYWYERAWGKQGFAFILRNASRKRDGVPVSWLLFNHSFSNFANWPNSAGIGPGVYKTQSKHTKNKSRYRTGTKGHGESKALPSYWMRVRGKRDGVPVSLLSDKFRFCNFANWPNSAGMGPEVYKTQSIHTKNKSRYRTGTIWLRKASLCRNIESKSGGIGMEYR